MICRGCTSRRFPCPRGCRVHSPCFLLRIRPIRRGTRICRLIKRWGRLTEGCGTCDCLWLSVSDWCYTRWGLAQPRVIKWSSARNCRIRRGLSSHRLLICRSGCRNYSGGSLFPLFIWWFRPWIYRLLRSSWSLWFPWSWFRHYRWRRDFSWDTSWWNSRFLPFRCSIFCKWGNLAPTITLWLYRSLCFSTRTGLRFEGCGCGFSSGLLCLLLSPFPCFCCRWCPWRIRTCLIWCCLYSGELYVYAHVRSGLHL